MMDIGAIHAFGRSANAFADPVTIGAVTGTAVLLVVAGVAIRISAATGQTSPATAGDLLARWWSWVCVAAGLLVPVILGRAWVIGAVLVLSLLCYREFARATGLFREKTISVFVVLGILLATFASIDNYDRLFFATSALTAALIAVGTIPQDRPRGYLQRVALGVLGFLLFGYNLAYIGFLANAADYRPLIILLLICVFLNDVVAFCCGRLIGGPQLLPLTSPGQTVAGAVGALVVTTLVTIWLGHLVFQGTPMDRLLPLVILGAGISLLGQLGDLLVSSVKCDLGLEETGRCLPGQGGLLDRVDSLVLVVPAYFHFLSLQLGPIGSDQVQRIITGG